MFIKKFPAFFFMKIVRKKSPYLKKVMTKFQKSLDPDFFLNFYNLKKLFFQISLIKSLFTVDLSFFVRYRYRYQSLTSFF
jgi:hypothetical protein